MKTRNLFSIALVCLFLGIFASSCHDNGKKASTVGVDSTHTYNYIRKIHISNPHLALNICDTMEANGEMKLFYLDHLRSAIYHNGLKMKRLSHYYGLRAVGDKRFETVDPESYLFCLRLMAEQDYKDSRYLSAMNLARQCVDKARKYGYPDTENMMQHLIGRCNVMVGNKEAGYKMMNEACVKALDLFKDKPDLYSADEIVFGYGTMLEMMFEQGHPKDALPCIGEMERRLDMVEKSGLVPEDILDMRRCAIYALIMKIYDATGNTKMGQLYCDKAANTKMAKSNTGDAFFTFHYLATRQYDKLLAVTKKMLNDLIEISEYESSEEKLDVAEVPVNSIMDAVRETRAEASAGVLLEYCMASESDTVTTNLEAVVRIMGCLVDNAVKNTSSGSIRVEYAKREGKDILSVTDTGRGIPADKAEKIFERFYKMDEFVPGVGLGLTLSRAIAAKINATVTLDTSYSGGARFLVAL